MTGEMIRVGMADMKIATAPNQLTTIGLGSCLGIILYDPVKKIAGMIHIMLPDSTQARRITKISKFADIGIPDMIKKMEKKGCVQRRMWAKIAGGSHMFNIGGNSPLMAVGERNAEATEIILKELKIPIKSSDMGGSRGRTIEFDCNDGKLKIRIAITDNPEKQWENKII